MKRRVSDIWLPVLLVAHVAGACHKPAAIDDATPALPGTAEKALVTAAIQLPPIRIWS